jgi:sugar phosphate permease
MAEIRRGRRYTLAILLAVYACNFMDRQILAILKPAIKQELGLSDTQLGLLSGLAFTLFFATLGLPFGLWADRARRASLVALALFLFSASALVGWRYMNIDIEKGSGARTFNAAVEMNGPFLGLNVHF